MDIFVYIYIHIIHITSHSKWEKHICIWDDFPGLIRPSSMFSNGFGVRAAGWLGDRGALQSLVEVDAAWA